MNKRGFTLIETMVYLALFAILMTGIISSVYILFESGDRNETKAMLQEEKQYLLGKVNYAFSGAKTVSSPAANSSGASLFLTKYDTTSVGMGISGTNMIYNGIALNNTNVQVTKLVFIHTFAGGVNPESIEAGFTLTAKTAGGETISQSASTTRYIRK
jgi:prepilin-type N-terminal cleavage/methylation domain-containing protein